MSMRLRVLFCVAAAQALTIPSLTSRFAAAPPALTRLERLQSSLSQGAATTAAVGATCRKQGLCGRPARPSRLAEVGRSSGIPEACSDAVRSLRRAQLAKALTSLFCGHAGRRYLPRSDAGDAGERVRGDDLAGGGARVDEHREGRA